MNYLIANTNIVNEGRIFKGSVFTKGEEIEKILEHTDDIEVNSFKGYEFIDASNMFLLPGVIDDQVHFREPGLTHKADIGSESRAAIAGGVTSFMDMPNTLPNTLTQDLLEEKYKLASEKSLANYSFYMGASNDNVKEIVKTDPVNACGIKVFMGASTGNMLVDNKSTLQAIFKEAPCLVATHCEDEATIQNNIIRLRNIYRDDIPIHYHPQIRSDEACYISTSLAIELAEKYNTRLHILHLSTALETTLFRNDIPLPEKSITAEVCIHHLWFNDEAYHTKGNLIKWNPAIKTETDRRALWKALLDNRLDVIATDHAPHTLVEKRNSYFKTPSGGPLIQHSLIALMEFFHQGKISIEKIVEKMCHAPAICFKVNKRGFIRSGYKADLVIVNPNQPGIVEKSNLLYKCGWSPFEGTLFQSAVTHTFVNGNLVYEMGKFDLSARGQRLTFNR